MSRISSQVKLQSKFERLLSCLTNEASLDGIEYTDSTKRNILLILSTFKDVSKSIRDHNLDVPAIVGSVNYLTLTPQNIKILGDIVEIIDFLIDAGELVPTKQAIAWAAAKLTLGSYADFLLLADRNLHDSEIRVAKAYYQNLMFINESGKSRLEKLEAFGKGTSDLRRNFEERLRNLRSHESNLLMET